MGRNVRELMNCITEQRKGIKFFPGHWQRLHRHLYVTLETSETLRLEEMCEGSKPEVRAEDLAFLGSRGTVWGCDFSDCSVTYLFTAFCNLPQ